MAHKYDTLRHDEELAKLKKILRLSNLVLLEIKEEIKIKDKILVNLHPYSFPTYHAQSSPSKMVNLIEVGDDIALGENVIQNYDRGKC